MQSIVVGVPHNMVLRVGSTYYLQLCEADSNVLWKPKVMVAMVTQSYNIIIRL